MTARKCRAAAAVIALSILSLPMQAETTSTTQKSSSQVLGEQTVSSLDALEKASEYSFETGGIGILIGFGTGNGAGVTAKVIGDQFVQEIKRRGMHSRFFYYNADWFEMTVEYHIRHSALGPWSVQDAAKHVSQAIDRAKAAQKIHGW